MPLPGAADNVLRTPCRLIIDPAASGAWNMAVDEVLFDWTGQTGRACLRFYRWDQPTLSLGYFQTYELRRGHQPSAGCPVVRRLTGGGAILHDRELTYSLALPSTHPLAKKRLALYEAVHQTLAEVLAEWRVEASLHPAGDPCPAGAQPFLCFHRRSPGDVVAGGVKVAGSAQRRSATAVLQHGSVLLDRSRCAPDVPGLADLAGPGIDDRALIGPWLRRLADRLAFAWYEEPLSEAEQAAASKLVETKYDNPLWTRHRGRAGAIH
ncbi:MAG TPA: lipoate--protein ligase family protein [Planctomycetes bacterium]|nr:lipoate--protein ligase family protein [Planctomycetota bacterium]